MTWARSAGLRKEGNSYPRIFVQQFVVIIGSFLFTMSGSGWAVLIVLVLVKTYFDLVLKDVSLSELAVKKNNQA